MNINARSSGLLGAEGQSRSGQTKVDANCNSREGDKQAIVPMAVGYARRRLQLGWRKGELLNLRVHQVDVLARTIERVIEIFS